MTSFPSHTMGYSDTYNVPNTKSDEMGVIIMTGPQNPLEPAPFFWQMKEEGYDGPEQISCHPFAGTGFEMAEMEFYSGAAEKLDTAFDKQFELVGIIAKIVQYPPRQGNPGRTGFIIGLIDSQRNILQTSSDSIAKMIDTFRTTLKMFPFNPPVMVEFKEGKSSSGFKTHQMQFVRPEKYDPKKYYGTYITKPPAKRS